MSATDWRGLCEELAGWIERSTRHYIQDPEVLIRARFALAQPEPEVVGPTDEELKATYWEAYREASMCGAEASWLAGLRAVARFGGRPAPAPAGEVEHG